MLESRLLLDANNVIINVIVVDTEINNGKVPDFILKDPKVVKVISEFNANASIGWIWDGTKASPPPETANT